MHVSYRFLGRLLNVKGGLVFYRGSGSVARAYLESDHSHADDYYLEHGTAEAQWDARGGGVAPDATVLSGEQYQSWVDWKDPHNGEVRGVPREESRVSTKTGEIVSRPSSPRFVEMNVNSDKSLSVAAALDPRVSAALDDAQAAAVEAMRDYLARNSVTRVGAKGEQRYVPVERIESVAVVHRTSRAGDPHRHVHLQWNARVFAEGKWRGLYTAGTLGQQDALRGVAEAAINSHEGLRDALAQAGFDFDTVSGKVRNLEPHAALLSKRSAQVQAGKATREATWRAANPGLEPSQKQLNQWDFESWADGRPQKAQAAGRSEAAWVEEMRAARLQTSGFAPLPREQQQTLDQLAWREIANDAIAVCESRGSAWSQSSLAGRIAEQISRRNVAATPTHIVDYAEQLATHIAQRSPVVGEMFAGRTLPDFVPCLTSDRVIAVERTLKEVLARRGLESGMSFDGVTVSERFSISTEQGLAAEALASAAPLVVVEGAAGAGKTTMLKAAQSLAQENGRKLLVVAPTLRAAQEASATVGVAASSAHRLAYEHGYRWDQNGTWSRLTVGAIDPATGTPYAGAAETFQVDARSRIVVDEAGMLDQDVAHALITIAEENGAAIAFIGDRAQLAAVGRGGVLDFAVAASPRPLDLAEVHRFHDPEYAALSLRMRDREAPRELFTDLLTRGDVRIYATEQAMNEAILTDALQAAGVGRSVAVAAATNEQAAHLNALLQKAHADSGRTSATRVSVEGADSLTIRRGDRIMTRQNDSALGVANRDVWTVQSVHADGSVAVSAVAGGRTVTLPQDYVQQFAQLAYASTEYGVQGANVDSGHGIVTDSSSAQGVYVAATRGRSSNTLHIVAENAEAAADVFTNAMVNEAGDRGLSAATEKAARHLEGISELEAAPVVDELVRAERVSSEQKVHAAKVDIYERALTTWQQKFPDLSPAEVPNVLQRLESDGRAATVYAQERAAALAGAAEAGYRHTWAQDYAGVSEAQQNAHDASLFTRPKMQQTAMNVTAEFTAKHRAEPRPQPPAVRIEQVRAAATATGADAQLDAARAAATQAQRQHEALKASPAPVAPRPPARGTAAQEAAKDAAYLKRVKQKTQTRESGRDYRPPTRTQTPGLER